MRHMRKKKVVEWLGVRGDQGVEGHEKKLGGQLVK